MADNFNITNANVTTPVVNIANATISDNGKTSAMAKTSTSSKNINDVKSTEKELQSKKSNDLQKQQKKEKQPDLTGILKDISQKIQAIKTNSKFDYTHVVQVKLQEQSFAKLLQSGRARTQIDNIEKKSNEDLSIRLNNLNKDQTSTNTNNQTTSESFKIPELISTSLINLSQQAQSTINQMLKSNFTSLSQSIANINQKKTDGTDAINKNIDSYGISQSDKVTPSKQAKSLLQQKIKKLQQNFEEVEKFLQNTISVSKSKSQNSTQQKKPDEGVQQLERQKQEELPKNPENKDKQGVDIKNYVEEQNTEKKSFIDSLKDGISSLMAFVKSGSKKDQSIQQQKNNITKEIGIPIENKSKNQKSTSIPDIKKQKTTTSDDISNSIQQNLPKSQKKPEIQKKSISSFLVNVKNRTSQFFKKSALLQALKFGKKPDNKIILPQNQTQGQTPTPTPTPTNVQKKPSLLKRATGRISTGLSNIKTSKVFNKTNIKKAGRVGLIAAKTGAKVAGRVAVAGTKMAGRVAWAGAKTAVRAPLALGAGLVGGISAFIPRAHGIARWSFVICWKTSCWNWKRCR